MVLKRLSNILQAKANKALDKAEDPREMLDLSYEKQIEMLRDVRRGVVEVTAARRRLELQAAEHRASLDKLDQQARGAMAMGREDLARAALERKAIAAQQVASFDLQVADMQKEQDRLVAAEARLQQKLDAFRTKKEVMKAQYTAAKATVRAGEAISGLSEEMADMGLAIERAEDKTQQLRARSQAIDELLEAGVLEDRLDGKTRLDAELEKAGAAYSVEVELERMRRELAAGPTHPALGPGQ